MDALARQRVVMVHDWLTGMRGGEKVLEVLCRQWPDAQLFTLLHRRGCVSETIERLPIRTSFLDRLPAVHRYYRYLLPLMPLAVQWQLPPCDLVISSSHCVAKGVTAPEGVPHICYCYTPMRYAWKFRDEYFANGSHGVKTWLRNRLLDRLRDWDLRTAGGVSHFVAISKCVQERIREYYGRSSVVIYPPVDTDFYCPAPTLPLPRGGGGKGGGGEREDYYVAFSAFAPYKRLDLAVIACNLLRRKLVVIGSGQDVKRLKNLAGPTVAFLGWQPDEVVRDHLRRCRALLFPGEEDFGIIPVEAQACGTPVIAFARGGATETVVPLARHWPGPLSAPTGIWFSEQTPESLAHAILQLEREEEAFDPKALRRNAQRFHGRRFAEEFFGYVAQVTGVSTPLPRVA